MLSELDIQADGFNVTGANVSLKVNKCRFKESHGVEVTDMRTSFAYNKTRMNISDFHLTTTASDIVGDITFSYERSDFQDFFNKSSDQRYIYKKVQSVQRILTSFIWHSGIVRRFFFQKSTNGTLNNLEVSNALLASKKQGFYGDVVLKNCFFF